MTAPTRRPPTLDDLCGEPPLVGPAPAEIRWHPDGRVTYLLAAGEERGSDLWAFSPASGGSVRLVRARSLRAPGRRRPLPLEGYQWLPDGQLLLGGGTLWLYQPGEAPPRLLAARCDPQVTPAPAPDGNRVAFVRTGDLWLVECAGGERRLTAGGGAAVLHGRLDWVYWEELAQRRSWRALEWSPDGEKIALLRLDQRAVRGFPLVDYLSRHPAVRRQRYPTPGGRNSIASVRIISSADGRLLAAHDEPDDTVYACPELAWTPDSAGVAWTRLARDQRSSEVRLIRLDGTEAVLAGESDPCWLNRTQAPRFLTDGSFLLLSEQGGRMHLFRHAADGSQLHPVTGGDWQVEEVHALRGDRVLLTGTGTDPRERHLYSARLDGGGCERITPEGGVYQANVRPDGGAAVIHARGPEAPAEWRLRQGNGDTAILHAPDPRWRERSCLRFRV